VIAFICFDKSKSERQAPIEEIITPFVPYSKIDIDAISSNLKSNDNKVD
jgi:hypothetical protein